MALEAERAHQRGIDRRGVRQRRAAEPGCDRGGPGAAADPIAALEDCDLQASVRKKLAEEGPSRAGADRADDDRASGHIYRSKHNLRGY